ncbi:hypothetical protein Tco_0179231 [Tanacetum coccineum]
MVFHNEDGNPARANIKQALGSFKDGDGDGDTQPHKGVKASANSDVMYSFSSAQDGDPLQDDVRLCLGDDLKKAQDHSQRQASFNSDANAVLGQQSVDQGLVGIRIYGSSGKSQDFKGVKRDIFGRSRFVFTILYPDERCVWIDLVGLAPLASRGSEVYKKLAVVVGGSSRGLDMMIVSSATEFAYWATILNRWRSIPSIISGKIHTSTCYSNVSCRFLGGVLREDCNGNEDLEDDAGEILGS